MSMRFLTPDTTQLTGVSVRRFFCVDAGLASYLTGAIDELTNELNWENFGDIGTSEIVEIFEEVIASMANCESIGVIFATVGNVPDGCLLMDGSSVAVSDYPELADVVPSWVSGSSIVLPDMRDSYLVGSGKVAVGESVGENEHTLTVSEMPAHTHDYVTAVASVSTVVIPDEPSAVPSAATTAPTGGGLPHNNMPLSLAVGWVVRAR